MFYLQHDYDDPYYNLAIEEVLLEPFIKESDSSAIFRVWKNPKSVIIGRGEKFSNQVFSEKTQADNVPVIRRVSGGGTVLHGPENINLSFFLPFHLNSELKNLKSSYTIILNWVIEALNKSNNLQLNINGSCDLVYQEKKVSGTAQARKRHGILHHMTLLLHADYSGMQHYLKEPSKRPDYRSERTHSDFVIGLGDIQPNFNLQSFIQSLKTVLNIQRSLSLTALQEEKALLLRKNKYSQDNWNQIGKI